MYCLHPNKFAPIVCLYLLTGCDIDRAVERIENYAQDQLAKKYVDGVTDLSHLVPVTSYLSVKSCAGIGSALIEAIRSFCPPFVQIWRLFGWPMGIREGRSRRFMILITSLTGCGWRYTHAQVASTIQLPDLRNT